MKKMIRFAPALSLGMILAAATPAIGATCSIPNTIANGQLADASKIMDNFNAVANCAQQGVTTTGTPVTGAISVFSGTGSITSSNLTGDVTTSGTAATLSNSGVTAGSYSNPTITVDKKGRVTSAVNGMTGGNGVFFAPTIVQSKLIVANQPATDGVAFDTPVTPGDIILALATHWSNNPTVGAGWTQILSTNGVVRSGVYASMKIATAADVASLFKPFNGGTGGQGLALFEIANGSPSATVAIGYLQEKTTAALILNGASAEASSLVIGIAASDTITAAPSAINGATAIGETQGITSNSSPVELTAFKIDAAPLGAANVALTYTSSAARCGIVVAIAPQ